MEDDCMENLRKLARDALQERNSASVGLQESKLSSIAIPEELARLWEYLSSQNNASNLEICENLLVALGFLKIQASKGLSSLDEDTVNQLYEWASNVALPSPVPLEVQESDDGRNNIIQADQLRSSIALSVIVYLDALLPIHKVANAPDVIIALSSFTSEKDPWTSPEAYTSSITLLQAYVTAARAEPAGSFWITIEKILKYRIRPVFAKTKNPAITAAGRKNFHPIPLPRFDASVLDPETKPWKIQDVYATTVLSWIIAQYQASDRSHLEEHFPLLVPAVLTLIDDDSLTFKTHGCTILSHLLIPIRESNSDILQRTNLSSVFEDAIRPCLLSLPSITPEGDSINLLGAAYPALLSILQTNHLTSSKSPQASKEAYLTLITKSLRENLIPSFHHISSTNTTSGSTFASFPYPRLSTLLLDHISLILVDLGIHTTKYLQEIIPLLYSTLANPFGPAYPPLLLSSLAVLRIVILNAHPRLWRWRGEILGAICPCWLHAIEEEDDIADRKQKGQSSASDESTSAAIAILRKEMRGIVYLLKFALQNPAQDSRDAGQLEAKENIDKELQELVDADEALRSLLMEDIDTNDASFFGSST